MFLNLCHFWILDNLYYLALKTAAPMPLRFIFHELQVPCVHIDQLFIFCPYWPIFLFLFSLEHQIGKRRPVHIDQVPIFLFRNKVENLGTWCTWDKSQVVASALQCIFAARCTCFTLSSFSVMLLYFLCCSFAVLQCNSVPGDLQHDYTKVQLIN